MSYFSICLSKSIIILSSYSLICLRNASTQCWRLVHDSAALDFIEIHDQRQLMRTLRFSLLFSLGGRQGKFGHSLRSRHSCVLKRDALFKVFSMFSVRDLYLISSVLSAYTTALELLSRRCLWRSHMAHCIPACMLHPAVY